MRPLSYDAHVQTELSGTGSSAAQCVRAAAAVGLECLGLTDHYHHDESTIPLRLEAARQAAVAEGLQVAVCADTDILDLDGMVSLSSPAAQRFALVFASLGGHCLGVDREVPARPDQFLDNLLECYFGVVQNPLVDVLARPFNLGGFPASLTPGELPQTPLRELAALMFEREVALELYAPIHLSYHDMALREFTAEYAGLLSIFREGDVKFIAGSGAQSAEAVGNMRYCQVLMEAAHIELSQLVDLTRVKPGSS